MTNLNKLFARYFIMAIITILLVMILIFNYASTIFFTNFLSVSYKQENETITNNIQFITAYNVNSNFFKKNAEAIARNGTIELVLKLDDAHIFSIGPKSYSIGPDETMYTRYFDDDEVIEYTTAFIIDDDLYTLYIYRLKDIRLVEQNVKFLNDINLMYLAVFVFAILLTTVLSLALSKHFNKPILTIRENINYIKKGQYGKIKETQTKALELKELSDDLNLLAISKENEDQIRKRLSNDIVHELKTPITALSANLEAILDGVYQADNERIKILLNQTERLSRLVNGLSKLTILETDSVKMETEKVNLSEIINDIKVTFEPAIVDKKILCTGEIEKDIYVIGNQDKLLQAFVNIVSNSLKYTEQGSIQISLQKMNKKAVVSVVDTGIGIAEKDVPYVFERFYRSDESRSRQTGGDGIGLAITKAVILSHDGDIEVKSEMDKGSTFTVTLDLFTEKG